MPQRYVDAIVKYLANRDYQPLKPRQLARQMGVADAPVAQHLEDYAPLALALGRDAERRRALRVASLEAAGRELFEDMRAVRDFESFLEAAVAAAGRGELLPPDWLPDMQTE